MDQEPCCSKSSPIVRKKLTNDEIQELTTKLRIMREKADDSRNKLKEEKKIHVQENHKLNNKGKKMQDQDEQSPALELKCLKKILPLSQKMSTLKCEPTDLRDKRQLNVVTSEDFPKEKSNCNQPSMPRAKKSKPNSKIKGTVNVKALEEKRVKEREKKRKQREKIRQNVEAHEKEKEKERERYKHRKEMGLLKPIHEKAPREQRRQRKKWKANIQRYREKKKNERIHELFLHNNSPPTSPENILPPTNSGPKKTAGRAKVRRNKTAAYRKIKKLKEQLLSAKKLADKYKKRNQRIKSNGQTPSPRKKVGILLKSGSKQDIKRKLLFGESIAVQLKTNSVKCADDKDRQLFSKVVSGTAVAKYGLQDLAEPFISTYMNREYANSKTLKYSRKPMKNAHSEREAEAIQSFLEEDCNSALAPGKKDTITLNKVIKTKRYLQDTLENLHTKFLESSTFNLSYSAFCKLKPFWVVKPNVADRDTCRCTKHANFEYMIEKLHLLKVVAQTKNDDITKIVCCDSNKIDCMFGICVRCKNKSIPIELGADKKNEECFYYSWETIKENRIDKNNKEIVVSLTVLQKITCTMEELVRKAQEALPQFCKHVYNVNHQFKAMKQLKESLCANEVVILMDFSENFICKYSQEVQSVHFGASKVQVTLHTGVVYHVGTEGENEKCISFCSISSSLRHDACAIWAHLQPVLKMIKEKLPQTDTIHFQSDGPTTQYRNKTNFFLMTYFCKKIGIKECTWNFTEAGHGKGPADGIGGVTKRYADQVVAFGKDIPDSTTLTQTLRDAELKVKYFEVTLEEINNVESILPKNLKPIPNTMKLHQLVWSSSAPRTLGLRILTCLSCGVSLDCKHYPVTPSALSFPNEPDIDEEPSPILDILPVSVLEEVIPTTVPSVLVNDNNSILNKDDESQVMPIATGNFVCAMYDDKWYPGKCV